MWWCVVVGCAVLSGFFCAVLGWPGAPKGGEKRIKNKLWETLLGAKIDKKIDEKSVLEGSWEALGRSWGPRWPVEAQKGRDAFPARNINRLLERSWGGLRALLGSSWGVLGDLWGALGRLFSLLGALGGVLGALRLQRPFREQFSLNLCCFLGGPRTLKNIGFTEAKR